MLDHPLRLATGSHLAGTGQGCAMNVISWENGDTEITDLPACADPLLARVVQRVNDHCCTHRDSDLLCAPCSVEVLALAHRTVGTALTDWSDSDRHRLYVRLALRAAESVASPTEDLQVTRCREVVRLWLDGAASVEQVREARVTAAATAGAAAATAYAVYATYATADAAATYATTYAAYADAYTTAYAVYATYATADAAATYATTYAAYAAAYATTYAYVAAATAAMQGAHRLIDEFEALTDRTARPVAAAVTAAAVTRMLAPAT